VLHVDVSAYDVALQALWSKRLTINVGPFEPAQWEVGTAHWGDAGDMFLRMNIDWDTYIVQVPANEQSGWAYRTSELTDEKIASDGNGGCFVVGRSLSFSSEGILEVIHLQHDGTVGFHRTYTMNDWFSTVPMNVQYAAGELTVIIDHSARGGVLVLDTEGEVLSYDKYAPLPAAPANTPYGVFGGVRHEDGTYIILGGIAGLQAKSMVLKLDANREPLEARSMNTVVQNNVRRAHYFNTAASVDNWLVVAGQYSEWDEVFDSQIVNWPVVWRFDGPIDNLCGDTEMQFAHVSVPPGNVTIEELVGAQVPVAVFELPAHSVTQIDAWGTEGFCEQFVGVDGVTERVGHELFTIANTLVMPGTALTIEAYEELEFHVVNSTGQTVHRTTLHKDETRSIVEPSWSSGMYHLLGIDRSGRRHGISILVHDR
jgi:hypothetical protein